MLLRQFRLVQVFHSLRQMEQPEASFLFVEDRVHHEEVYGNGHHS